MKTPKADGDGGASRPEADSNAKTAPSDSVDGEGHDRLVGRTEAARLLGVSIATLCRRERTVPRADRLSPNATLRGAASLLR
jgi:hypothetical protein